MSVVTATSTGINSLKEDSLKDRDQEINFFCEETIQKAHLLIGKLIEDINTFQSELKELVDETDSCKEKYSNKNREITIETYNEFGTNWAQVIKKFALILGMRATILRTLNENDARVLDLTKRFNELKKEYTNGIQHSWRGLRDNYKVQSSKGGYFDDVQRRFSRYASTDYEIEESTIQEFGLISLTTTGTDMNVRASLSESPKYLASPGEPGVDCKTTSSIDESVD